MFSGAISTNDINDILIKGIPALSRPLGRRVIREIPADVPNTDMNLDDPVGILRPNDWPLHDKYGDRWLHSQLIYVAHYYSYKLYEKFIVTGGLE